MSNAIESRFIKASLRHKLFGGSDESVRIGRYRLTARLGSGTTGVVFSALDEKLERSVALKILHDRFDHERFGQEAIALARIAHPHVVAVFDVGVEAGQTFVAMALLDGGTLRTWQTSQERAWPERLGRWLEAGRGLAAAHAQGIVHRDFKPENVLVDRDGRAQVVDFGLALGLEPDQGEPREAPALAGSEAVEVLTATSAWVGTPAYMSPEQFAGRADAKSDQFAFAVCVFEALYRKRPFSGSSIEALRAQIERGAILPVPAGDVPRQVHRAIVRALSPDPDDRFDDLNGLLEALSPSVRPTPRPTLLAAGALVTTLLGAGVYGAWWSAPVLPPERSQSAADAGPTEGRSTISLAVLPFADEARADAGGADPTVADAITDELIDRLGAVRDLRVVGRQSSFHYEDHPAPLPRVAADLRVRYILDGRVRVEGERVIIQATLFDGPSEESLWTRSFAATTDATESASEAVVSAVAERLKLDVPEIVDSVKATYRARNPDAYRAYQRGQAFRRENSKASFDRAIDEYRRALALDEDFALALEGLAFCRLLLVYYGRGSRQDAVTEAEPLVRRALELEPDFAEAHATMALVHHMVRRYPEADASLDRAIALNPNLGRAYILKGLNYLHEGRLKEASGAYMQAQLLDPKKDSTNFNYGVLLMTMGRYEEGLSFLSRVPELNPRRTAATFTALGHWMAHYGRLVDAIASCRRALRHDAEHAEAPGNLLGALVMLGLWKEAGRLAERAPADVASRTMFQRWALRLAWRTDDRRALDRRIEAQLRQAEGSSPEVRRPVERDARIMLARRQARDGDLDRALRTMTEAIGGVDAEAPISVHSPWPWLVLSTFYRGLGRDAEADRVVDRVVDRLEKARDDGHQTPHSRYALASAYALKGDQERALDELEAAIEQGWRVAGALEQDPWWAPLRDEPVLAALGQRVASDLAAQREEVRASGLLEELFREVDP